MGTLAKQDPGQARLLGPFLLLYFLIILTYLLTYLLYLLTYLWESWPSKTQARPGIVKVWAIALELLLRESRVSKIESRGQVRLETLVSSCEQAYCFTEDESGGPQALQTNQRTVALFLFFFSLRK